MAKTYATFNDRGLRKTMNIQREIIVEEMNSPTLGKLAKGISTCANSIFISRSERRERETENERRYFGRFLALPITLVDYL